VPMLNAMTDQSAEFATLTSDDLVTGEAVALDLPPASVGARVVSGLIDIAVTVTAMIAVTFFFSAVVAGADDALLTASLVASTITIFLVIPTTIETLSRGKSLGKLVMGLRTVRDDAGPISFQHAFVRALIGFVEIYLLSGVPAFFSALLTRHGKRLGDQAAGTYVIRERFRLQLPPPTPMPEHLRAWAQGADIAPLPTNVALATRQYLARLHQITPQSRVALGLRLANQVQPFVSPGPPPGTPPEAFLAAVISARRERDRARLGREAELISRLTKASGAAGHTA
jgi:uncharacterized RDD family membrane protein YckC